MTKNKIKVALIGNPNTGKTSVFNALTGLNQHVGNYPGVTVEKKYGEFHLDHNNDAILLDLPGTYSLNSNSLDENIVTELLLNRSSKDFPDVAVVVAEPENLKRNLLLFTQVKELNIPTILLINMSDRMELKGISIDVDDLSKELKTTVCTVSARKNQGFDSLKEAILGYAILDAASINNALVFDRPFFDGLQQAFPNQNLYSLWLQVSHEEQLNLPDQSKLDLKEFKKSDSEIKKMQQKETIQRYKFINDILKKCYVKDQAKTKDFTGKLDQILTHKVWGYFIFAAIMLLIFQSIFEWSGGPMDFIDESFSTLSAYVGDNLPPGTFTSLLSEGIIPGIGGVVIFIPQIAFLFLFISVLEESGYMSRVVFLMDRGMRKFGLSGKSVVPLISGTACAIPAIMSTRNIENWKERLITILVTPFTTCSARLPVYSILIALVIPETTIFGFINAQGFALFALYFLGFFAALISSYILDKILKSNIKTYFVVEMPNYKMPIFKNIAFNVFEKTKSFVMDAGKIILAFSIILWFLASYGPGDNFNNAEEIVTQNTVNDNLSDDELQSAVVSFQLENSYIGIMGHTIEPVIKPLGYDWKMGIAIISSFAAREVFVGTLATIYSVGDTDDEATIKERMATEINENTGEKAFNFATGISLLLFYAFAMQCTGTIAIVKKETNSWKWPLIQLVAMSALAYFSALLAYQTLI